MSFEIQELELDSQIPEDSYNIILKDRHEHNALTRIVVNDVFYIYLYWSSESAFSNTVETLVLPEKYILFIGSGCTSAQVNLNNSTLIRQREVIEFTGFYKYDNCIIECCYGECTAFNLDGDILNHHELSMMWGIEFKNGCFYTNCHDNGLRKLVELNT